MRRYTEPLASRAGPAERTKLFLYLSPKWSRIVSPSTTCGDSFVVNFQEFVEGHALPHFTLVNMRPSAATQPGVEDAARVLAPSANPVRAPRTAVGTDEIGGKVRPFVTELPGPWQYRSLFRRPYATESVSLPFDGLLGVGLITIWTSRPNRVRHSNKRCSEIPRNRPFKRSETLGCVNPRVSAAWAWVSARRWRISAILAANWALISMLWLSRYPRSVYTFPELSSTGMPRTTRCFFIALASGTEVCPSPFIIPTLV